MIFTLFSLPRKQSNGMIKIKVKLSPNQLEYFSMYTCKKKRVFICSYIYKPHILYIISSIWNLDSLKRLKAIRTCF